VERPTGVAYVKAQAGGRSMRTSIVPAASLSSHRMFNRDTRGVRESLMRPRAESDFLPPLGRRELFTWPDVTHSAHPDRTPIKLQLLLKARTTALRRSWKLLASPNFAAHADL